MDSTPVAPEWLRKYLQKSELSFEQFMRLALYDPQHGYYATRRNPVGQTGDFVTSPKLSPVFSFAISRLATEFVSRMADGVCSVVDVGCGDGSLIESVAVNLGPESERIRFYGVDQSLERVDGTGNRVSYVTAVRDVPSEAPALVFSNELFDALPFARLVMRGETLRELCVAMSADGTLDWSERDAGQPYLDYFAARSIRLEDGQFADVSLEWEAVYAEIVSRFDRALFVTFDYGHEESSLFKGRARRYGTAVAYAGHRASRDLLARAGEQDLTAHINFSDLIRAGERQGLRTLSLDRQGLFLMKAGAGEHPLLQPVAEEKEGSLADALAIIAERQAAMSVILPDGPGVDIRVLVQGRTMPERDWSFQHVPR